MDFAVELAKQIKARDNITKIGSVIGEVLSIEPLKIGILNNQIVLDKSNSYICSSLVSNYIRQADVKIKEYTVNVSATDSNGDTINNLNVSEKSDYNMEIAYKNILQIGDKVLVNSIENNQTFFIVDKIAEVV